MGPVSGYAFSNALIKTCCAAFNCGGMFDEKKRMKGGRGRSDGAEWWSRVANSAFAEVPPGRAGQKVGVGLHCHKCPEVDLAKSN